LSYRILNTLSKEETDKSSLKLDYGHASEVGTRPGEIGLKFIPKDYFAEWYEPSLLKRDISIRQDIHMSIINKHNE
jgi:hypothetical protein